MSPVCVYQAESLIAIQRILEVVGIDPVVLSGQHVADLLKHAMDSKTGDLKRSVVTKFGHGKNDILNDGRLSRTASTETAHLSRKALEHRKPCPRRAAN